MDIRTAIKNMLPDPIFLKLCYRRRIGKKLDLKNPRTFNEKLQWLKLHDRNPLYTVLVDKYAVKDYVAEKVGGEHIIPTLGVWDRFEDIDFDVLPDQFVLKCTHDSGGLVIVRDKAKLDIAAARTKINKSLSRNYYYAGREWPYKNVKPRIIAEKYMTDQSCAELADYKVHCFNGEAKVVLVCQDRHSSSGLTEDFFTKEWEHLDIQRPKHPNAKVVPERPVHLEQILQLSEQLAQGYPFMRVDFYDVNGQIYFGEITFFPASGFEAFVPAEWDTKLGDWLRLP